jgi:hypothetical protein
MFAKGEMDVTALILISGGHLASTARHVNPDI